MNDIQIVEDSIGEESTFIKIENHPPKKVIYILNQINQNTAIDIIKELLETDWKKEAIEEIHIYVSSQGGFLSDCFSIIDLLQKVKTENNIKISTFGLGEVASAGFFIFILGDNRYLFPSGRIFVHSHITTGKDETYEEKIKSFKTDEKNIYQNYLKYTADRLDISLRKAKTLLRKGKWLTESEISEYNIVNKGTK